MYKGLSTIPFERFFSSSTATNTRGHSAKIAKHHCHGGAENDGHEIAGHENDGPNSRA